MVFLISETVQFFYMFFFKNRKWLGLLGLIILAYLAGTANPNMTTDYANYSWSYYFNNTPETYNFETGYSDVAAYFYKVGVSYANFRLIIFLIGMAILFWGISRFTKNIVFFSAFYGATVFFNDATQVRNFLMMSIIILSLSFLTKPSVRNFLVATILIILSAQVQSVGYIFLLIIPIRLILNKRFKWGSSVVVIGTIGLMVVTRFLGNRILLSFGGKIFSSISSRENLTEKITNQYSYGTSFTRMTGLVIVTIVVYCLEAYIVSHISAKNEQLFNKVRVLYSGVILSVFTLPLLYLAVDYCRIQRDAWLFVILTGAIYFDNKTEDSKTNQIYLLIFFVIVAISVAIVHSLVWGTLYEQSIPYLMKLVK